MDQQKFPRRATAYRFWIKDLLNASKIDGKEMILFNVRGKEVSRVNLMATIVDKQINEDKTFATITLDDGTETIRVKAWKEDIRMIEKVNIGDQIMVIGKIRNYGGELSVIPEIIKKQEPEWLLLRRKELEAEFQKPEEKKFNSVEPKIEESVEQEIPIVEEEVINEPTETGRQKILTLIESESSSEGAQIGLVVQKSGLKEEEAERIIDELLKEGEIFQPRNGFLKVI